MYDRSNPYHVALRWLQETVYSAKRPPYPPVHNSNLAAFLAHDDWPVTYWPEVVHLQQTGEFKAMLAWLHTPHGRAEAIAVLNWLRLKSWGMFGVKIATKADFPSEVDVSKAILLFKQEPRNEYGWEQFNKGVGMYAVAVLPNGRILTANEPYGDKLLNPWPQDAKW